MLNMKITMKNKEAIRKSIEKFGFEILIKDTANAITIVASRMWMISLGFMKNVSFCFI